MLKITDFVSFFSATEPCDKDVFRKIVYPKYAIAILRHCAQGIADSNCFKISHYVAAFDLAIANRQVHHPVRPGCLSLHDLILMHLLSFQTFVRTGYNET